MRKHGTVEPGKPAIDRICSTSRLGERILREVAHPSTPPSRQRREFDEWIDSACHGVVSLNGSSDIPLSLHLGVEEVEKGPRVLFLKEGEGSRVSLKPSRGDDGVLVLTIGRELREKRIPGLASQIVAIFVLHGFGWKTTKREEPFAQPWGDEPDPAAQERRKAQREAKRERNRRKSRFQGF